MANNNIKVKVKLTAYTKGIIPDVSDFIKEAPKDGNVYVRQDGEWVNIKEGVEDQVLVVDQTSGLSITPIEDSNKAIIRIKQVVTDSDNLPDELEEDTTYYVEEVNRPILFINGGTASSDEDEEYEQIIYGGNAHTSSWDFKLLPLNSRGE